MLRVTIELANTIIIKYIFAASGHKTAPDTRNSVVETGSISERVRAIIKT